MYANNNEKAIAFAKAEIRQIEPRMRELHEKKKLAVLEVANVVEGKPNKASGKTNADRLKEELERLRTKDLAYVAQHAALSDSIAKLSSPEDAWPTLDEEDRLALCRHHRSVISRHTGTKTFLKD